ncbi:hypothetical protein PENANT_c015G04990 [Penicillium antarcticum]|uniref:WW domain-containing protein n=1 Tax=Penicillium antarcticum TaxID=416450 RepID=A0A1V6Q3Q5_9EURO|nr:uncharacterized protein N7508_004957 [Penicillium antarcticum]KAJ5305942.1 hypothetical protein N7508_004957 [Penicillium antarcticum]OQD83898.1 hypothetical protein PENANT_c015G04990 [Penicillium antarcticum]
MAPEAPADTAGPSSPPPRLPEGWLAQWEGVQRKWYFVQRTTGKSQWDIPTEPVLLTPSTTPIPGPGPSQAPNLSQMGNSSRAVEIGDTKADMNRSAADSATVSSSGHSPMYGGSENPMHGSAGVLGPYSNQTGQHMPGAYAQHHAGTEGGYGSRPLQHAAQINGAQPTFYSMPGHPGYQHAPQHLNQGIPSAAWGNAAPFQSYSGFGQGYHSEPFQGFSTGPSASLWKGSQTPQGQMTGQMASIAISQPQWQTESQSNHSNGHGDHIPMNAHSSTLSQPFFGSYSSHNGPEQSTREFPSRSSDTSLPREGQPSQLSMDGFPEHSPQSVTDQAISSHSYPVSRSQPQHPSTDPALQGFSPLQHAQAQYQQQHMLRIHPGPGINPQSQHGQQGNINQYQNPLGPIGSNGYMPQQQFGHSGGGTGFSETAHQMAYTQSSHAPGTTRQAPFESQFVSGPWKSTPPSSGPP